MTLHDISDPLPSPDEKPSTDKGARKRGRPAAGVDDATPDGMTERSGRIVEAAYGLLEEAGLEGLTIRAVLTRTGLSRRAFYERFAGKDDMVLAVFQHTIAEAAAHFAKEFQPVADPLERLCLIVSSITLAHGSIDGIEPPQGSHVRGAALSREHLRLAESRPDELQAALRPLLSLFARIVEEGMETGQIRRTRPDRLATLIYNLVATTVHAQLLAEETGEIDRAVREELAADIWEFCRRAIIA